MTGCASLTAGSPLARARNIASRYSAPSNVVDCREQQTPGYFKSAVNAACAKQYPTRHLPNRKKAENSSRLRRHFSGILAPRAREASPG